MLKRITAANADADNFEANVDYIEPSLIDQSPQDIIEAADYYIEPTSIDQSTHDKLIVDSISNDWIEQDQVRLEYIQRLC